MMTTLLPVHIISAVLALLFGYVALFAVPIPVLAPIAMMLYWLWKMRGTRTIRGVTVAPRIDQTMEAGI